MRYTLTLIEDVPGGRIIRTCRVEVEDSPGTIVPALLMAERDHPDAGLIRWTGPHE